MNLWQKGSGVRSDSDSILCGYRLQVTTEEESKKKNKNARRQTGVVWKSVPLWICVSTDHHQGASTDILSTRSAKINKDLRTYSTKFLFLFDSFLDSFVQTEPGG